MNTAIRNFLLAFPVLSAFALSAAEKVFLPPVKGEWNEPANWQPAGLPGSDDDVVITDSSVHAAGSLRVRSLTLEGKASLRISAAELADKSVFTNQTGLARALYDASAVVSAAESICLKGSSVIYPESATVTGVPVRFETKDLYVGEGASFIAVKCGWGWSDGPVAEAPVTAKPRYREGPKPMTNGWTIALGAGRSYYLGGRYEYGRAEIPFMPGSPSGNYYAGQYGGLELGRGPGSIVIFASGKAEINGRLVADADFTPNKAEKQDGGRPSGGAILLGLADAQFGPRALLSAKGGSPVQGNQFGPGGGGRIAVGFGLSADDWSKMVDADLPAGVSVTNDLGILSAYVGGGQIPSGKKKGPDGTIAYLFRGEVPSFVSVRNDSAEIEVTPPAGTSRYEPGSTVHFSAPALAKDAGASYRYTCLGYTVSNLTGVVASGAGTNISLTIGKEPLSVTWKWGNKEYAPRASSPSDCTIVCLVPTNSLSLSKPLQIAGAPESIGLEFDGDATGATAEISLADKSGKSFTLSSGLRGEFTLIPFDKESISMEDSDSLPVAPYTLMGYSVNGTTNVVKSVRALYIRPLGRSARHFASVESRGQRLGGRIVPDGETESVELAEGTTVRFVLHNSKGVRIVTEFDNGKNLATEFSVADQTEKLLADFLGLPKGTPFTVRDSVIQHGRTRLYVRPYFRPYRSNSEMVPMGYDYLADNENLPGARAHVNTVSVRREGTNRYFLWWDGSRETELAPPRTMPGVNISGVSILFTAGAEYTVEKDTAVYDRDRYEVLDLSANPRAKAFAGATFASPMKAGFREIGGIPIRIAEPIDSADVAICHQGKGTWALEVDEYTGRKPSDGFGAAVHFRVPAREYVRANIVFALDPDTNKDKVLNLRLAHYILNGSGSNMIGDSQLAYSEGVPESAVMIGSVVRDGRSIPLYYASVLLSYSSVIPEVARGGYVDFELLGVKKGMKPDAVSESAFNVFAVTLEAAPVSFDLRWAPDAPANVFTHDETNRTFQLKFRGERKSSAAEVSWKVSDFEGRELFRGAETISGLGKGEFHEIGVDTSRVKETGLYIVDVSVKGDGGKTDYSCKTRFAVLPESGRLEKDPRKSPYSTWWFYGAHGSPADWDLVGPLLKKAGIRRASHKNWPKSKMEKYSVTYTGQVNAPSQRRDFDAATGKFKKHGDLDGEQWFVTNITEQISRLPFADHLMIWHESCPSGVIPEEILGLPVPPANDEDRAAAAYINECGRLARKYFPQLRIQIGNSSASLGASYRPFRGGANPEYYDAIGIETPSQTMMPERLLVWGLQGMMISKEAASYYAKRPVPAAGAYEYVYRTERAIGEELQAAWYMRDVLISLANRMPMISPAITFDVRNAYYDTLWGRSGMLLRAPYCEPKLSYVAYAVLTKMIDGAEYLGQIDTGSTTVYALAFRRIDGKYVTAVWTARGEASLTADVEGKVDWYEMCGKASHFASAAKAGAIAASEMPSYFVTDNEVKSLRITKRAFRQAGECAAAAEKIFSMADAAGDELSPDKRIKSKGHACLPIMQPSEDFTMRTVDDSDKGRVLEISLDTSKREVNRYITEYSTVRLGNPPEIKAGAKAIGIWVKGNSSWGQVRFELTDADGDVYVNYGHPGLWDTLDWQGLLCVNFDGWAYISCNLPSGGDMSYSRSRGLINRPWNLEVRGKGRNAGKFNLPAKLTAVTVGMNREKLDLLDFKKTDTVIRLGDVCVE